MALFLDGDKYALFSSPNLIQWTRLSDIPEFGAGECPDLFELPVEGEPGKARWVFWGANKYLIGSFNGIRFVKESGPHIFEFGNNYYAAQTYSDIPAADGRRIQIAWMTGGQYPHMPFNQQMAFPAELTLRQTPEGLRLFKRPIRELDTLHGTHFQWHGTLKQGDNPLASVAGDLFDVRMEIDPATAARVSLTIRGAKLDYEAKSGKLSLLGKTAVVSPGGAKIKLQILVDRSSIEVFRRRRASRDVVVLHSGDRSRKAAAFVGRRWREYRIARRLAIEIVLAGLKWSGRGSNPQPLHCERSALPIELPPRSASRPSGRPSRSFSILELTGRVV